MLLSGELESILGPYLVYFAYYRHRGNTEIFVVTFLLPSFLIITLAAIQRYQIEGQQVRYTEDTTSYTGTVVHIEKF